MFSRLLIPVLLFNLSNLTFFTGLVSMSASWHFVLQCSSSRFPLLTWSLRKWYLLFMCLLQPWHTGWFARSIADLLSTNIFIFLGSINLSSSSNISIHATWHDAYDVVTYSASQDDKSTMFCFLQLHEIGVPSIMNMYPTILFFSS